MQAILFFFFHFLPIPSFSPSTTILSSDYLFIYLYDYLYLNCTREKYSRRYHPPSPTIRSALKNSKILALELSDYFEGD